MSSTPSGLPSIMDLISDDTVEVSVQKNVLKLIEQIFQPCFQDNGGWGRSNQANNSRSEIQGGGRTVVMPHDPSQQFHAASINLFDSYSSILCCAFIHCGLIESLTNLCILGREEISTAAVQLLSDVIVLSSRLLPEVLCNQLLTMPELIRCAAVGYNNATQLNQEINSQEALEKGVNASCVLRSLAEVLSDSGDGASLPRLAKRHCIGSIAGLLQSSNVMTASSVDESNASTRRQRMMEGLKQRLELGVDKKMLETQLSASNVEKVKDWKEWDWDAINDILEDGLQSGTRLGEALRGKFIKRLGGYFRCSPEEKGFFAHIEWAPDNVKYMESACHFYEALLRHPEGLLFLKSDRRGKMFEEIEKQLSIAISHAESAKKKGSASTKPASLVFDRSSASRYMAREYFAIVGRIFSVKEREFRQLETVDNIIDLLSTLCQHCELDYLTRIALCNLDYDIERSRMLLDTCINREMEGERNSNKNSNKNSNLALHGICILRAIVRSNADEFTWGIKILTAQLHSKNEEVSASALSVLHEASQHSKYLAAIIQTQAKGQLKITAIDRPLADSLLVKFASTAEGLAFLEKHRKEWFEESIMKWKSKKNSEYIRKVEAELTDALNRSRGKPNVGQPPTAVPLNIAQAAAFRVREDKLLGEGLNLESLLRMPWVVDIVINKNQRSVGRQGKRISLDTRLDVDRGESASDKGCFVVTGNCVDREGREDALPCSLQDCVHSSLFIGACPVMKDGSIGRPLLKWTNQEPGIVENSSALPTSSDNFKLAKLKFEESRDTSSWRSSGTRNTTDASADEDEDNSRCDWSTCALGGRKVIKGFNEDGKIMKVTVQGEPVTYFFRANSGEKKEGDDEGNDLFLTKVEYSICLEPRKRVITLSNNHMFGELAKTERGKELLKKKHIVEELSKVFEAGREGGSLEELKCSSWNLAFICSAAPGLSLVQETFPNFFSWLCKAAYSSQDYNLRGSCYCMLRLIAQTDGGRHIIGKHGWTCLERGSWPCPIPSSFDNFFQADTEIGYQEEAAAESDDEIDGSKNGFANTNTSSADEGEGKNFKKLLNAVGKLGDQITMKEAMSSLEKMRNDKSMKKTWKDPKLATEIHKMLESYTFDLDCRRFVWDLMGVGM